MLGHPSQESTFKYGTPFLYCVMKGHKQKETLTVAVDVATFSFSEYALKINWLALKY